MMSFSYRAFAALVILLCVSSVHGQSNKVVVIPLGGDEIDRCAVTAACLAGQATVTCPSGETVIPCAFPPTENKRVFVTSTTTTGIIGGLDGADLVCQGLADTQGLIGVFKAWLADSTGSPSTRFTQSATPYVLLNGEIIADDWQDLTDGTLSNPIDVFEDNTPFMGSGSDVFVWTNVGVDGQALSTSQDSCTNWSVDTNLAFIGSRTATDSTWTFLAKAACSDSLSLYCFEQ